MASNVNLRLRFIAKTSISPKTFDAVKIINLATKRKSYTPTINNMPLNIAWTTKKSAIAYAIRVFNRYKRLLEFCNENS